MSDQQQQDGRQAGSEGELAPDRPTEDAEDLASQVHEEEAQEQGGSTARPSRP